MLDKIRDIDHGIEYDFGKIYSFDTWEEAWNFYQTINKNFIPVKTFTNTDHTKFYCQIEILFTEILNPELSIAIPNKIPEEELEKLKQAMAEEQQKVLEKTSVSNDMKEENI